jgi:hypothetical protein
MPADPLQLPVQLERAIIAGIDPHELVYHRVLGSSSNDIVLEATLSQAMQQRFQFAAPMRFAARFVYNFGIASSAMTSKCQEELELLSSLPPHRNVTVYVGAFKTELPDIAFDSLSPILQYQATYVHDGKRVRRKVLLVLLRYHPLTLEAYLRDQCPQPTPLSTFYRFAVDLLSAHEFFEEHRVRYFDASPGNVLVELSTPDSPGLIVPVWTSSAGTSCAPNVDHAACMNKLST